MFFSEWKIELAVYGDPVQKACRSFGHGGLVSLQVDRMSARRPVGVAASTVIISSMARTRLLRTAEDHVRGGNHLLYETIMVFNDAALLDDRARWRGDHGWETKTLYMAVVESLLVHRRNLMDFYFPHPNPDNRRRHDMIAADFCASWTEARPVSFIAEFDAIGEQILHLTYLRREVAPNWNYGQMRTELRELTMKFLDAADGRLHESIKAQLREIAQGERTIGRAVTLVATTGSVIDPATLSGLTPGLSTPTSTTLADRNVT